MDAIKSDINAKTLIQDQIQIKTSFLHFNLIFFDLSLSIMSFG